MAVREISTKLALEGEKEFQAEMKAASSNLGVLKSEMKAVTAEFAENAGKSDALRAKQKVLNDTYAQQKEITKGLGAQLIAQNVAYEKAGKDVAQYSADIEALKSKMAAEAAASGENTKAYKDMDDALSKLEKNLNKAQKDYARLPGEIDRTTKKLHESEAATSDAEHAMKANAEQLRRVNPFYKRLAEGVDEVKNKLKALPAASANALMDLPAAAGGALKGGLEGTAKAIGTLTAAGFAATGALATLAVSGIGVLSSYAKEAAESGNESFSTLAANLTSLDGASASAKAALGSILLPALESLSGEGAQLLNEFSAAMANTGGDTEAMGRTVAYYIRRAAQLMKKELPQFIEIGGELLKGLASGISDNLDSILDAGADVIEMLLDGLTEGADDIGTGISTVVLTLVNFLIESAPEMLEAGIALLVSLLEGLTSGSSLQRLIEAIPVLVESLLTALISNAPQLTVAGITLIGQLALGLIKAVPQLIMMVPELLGDLKDAFIDHKDEILTVGTDIVGGIKQGIADAWSALKEWFGGLFDGLIGGVKEKLGIASPSKVFAAKIGKPMGQGVGVGFAEGMDESSRTIEGELAPSRFARNLSAHARSVAFGSSGERRGAGTVINLYAQTVTKDTVDYLIRLSNAQLGEEV